MKPTKRFVFVTLLILALPAAPLLWANGAVYGELDLFDLIMGIIENPDPIAQCHYVQLNVDPGDPDAREKGKRDDGRPAFDFDRASSEPMLTWAYDAGSDHDIAFNTWDGDDWDSKIEFLTSSTVDELDPRLHVDRFNNTFITWWEDDAAGRILLAKRNQLGTWSPPTTVATGRRPSVAVWDDDLVLAYERDRGPHREIVFARSYKGGPFVFSTVAMTVPAERLDPVIHVRDGVMWIDWKHGDQTLGFSTYQNGQWKPLRIHPWNDPSWIGELAARYEIEVRLLR